MSLATRALVLVVLVGSGARACPKACACRWKGGKETVECVRKGLTALPANMDAGTQVLDLSGNPLLALPKELFLGAGLLNLQRIYLAHCRISQVSESSFARLTNLVELDLSHNSLQVVPSSTFKDFPALRKLVLSGNPINRIESQAFINLPKLTSLEISRCRLQTLGTKAFEGLTDLTHLKLDGNLLVSLRAATVSGLRKLHEAELHGNPWRCDCQLRDMRTWLVKDKIPFTVPPVCDQPLRLRGIELQQLDVDDLACEPRIPNPPSPVDVVRSVANEDAVLVCRVLAYPEAHVHWEHDGRTLTSSPVSPHNSLLRMYQVQENGTTEKISTLTISAVQPSDAGLYICIAQNNAGSLRTNITLKVTVPAAHTPNMAAGQAAVLAAGVLLASCGLLLGVWALFRRRRRHCQKIKERPSSTTSSCSSHAKTKHVNNHTDSTRLIKKPLLARCNPVNGRDVTPYARDFLDTDVVNANSCLGNKPDVVNVEDSSAMTMVQGAESRVEYNTRRARDKRWDGVAGSCSLDSRQPRRALLRTSPSGEWAGSTQGLLAHSPQSSLDESSSSGSGRNNSRNSASANAVSVPATRRSLSELNDCKTNL